MSFRDLSVLQLDTLRELGNIGMGHAATALSQLMGRSVHLRVPQVSVADLDEVPALLGGAEQVVAGIILQMRGGARGNILLIFPEASVGRLVGDLLGPDTVDPLEDPLGCSTLREIGNILASAYLSALGALLRMPLIPSVPRLALDMAGAVIDAVLIELGESGDQALVLETEFFGEGHEREPIRGHFFLLPDPDSLQVILAAAGGEA
jgi:chemotaxis protein CheC